jgi:hypothetical protein
MKVVLPVITSNGIPYLQMMSNDVGRIAQHIKKVKGRKEGNNGVFFEVTNNCKNLIFMFKTIYKILLYNNVYLQFLTERVGNVADG